MTRIWAKTQEGIQRTRAWTSWGVGGTNLQLKLQNKKKEEGEWVLLKYERERERAWSWEMGGRGRLRTFVPWLLVPNKSSSICIRREGTKLLQKPSSYRWASWSCTQWHSSLQSNNIDHHHHRPTHPRIKPPKKKTKRKKNSTSWTENTSQIKFRGAVPELEKLFAFVLQKQIYSREAIVQYKTKH